MFPCKFYEIFQQKIFSAETIEQLLLNNTEVYTVN